MMLIGIEVARIIEPIVGVIPSIRSENMRTIGASSASFVVTTASVHSVAVPVVCFYDQCQMNTIGKNDEKQIDTKERAHQIHVPLNLKGEVGVSKKLGTKYPTANITVNKSDNTADARIPSFGVHIVAVGGGGR